MEIESGDIDKGAERNTDRSPGATPILGFIRWLSQNGRWLDIAILILAAFLRLWALDEKPAHFDEGVNGYFLDDMTRRGFYHYDPTNFHGPLHFYILFVMQTLFGREIWALRLPLALASVACVVLALFGFRRFLSPTASRIAAVAMAVSPAFVFYGRYAIHETWLVLFLMMTAIGLGNLWATADRRNLWLVGAGLTGMFLTKETWIIHVIAMGLAAGTLLILERVSPSSSMPWPRSRWTFDDFSRVFIACFAVTVFFYSGALLDPAGLFGIAESFVQWAATGARDEGSHQKPFWYWFELLYHYEWPLAVGVLASVAIVLPGTNRFIRWLAIAAGGSLAAYAIVKYKTPWCLIAWAWPFFLVLGLAIERVAQRLDRWVVGGLATVLALVSFAKCRTLAFEKFSDESEPYAYVQTTLEIHRLLGPLRWQVERDPTSLFNRGCLLQTEQYPMRWLLGDRPNVHWGGITESPEMAGGDWIMIDSTIGKEIEASLTEPYFRETVQVRGMADWHSTLYLRAEAFAEYFPGREPEFQPGDAASLTNQIEAEMVEELQEAKDTP